jgi:hypothetical protein
MRRGLIREGCVLLGIGLVAGGLVMLRRAWMISQNRGFPLLSWQTWAELRIYVIVAGLLVAVRLAWYLVTRKRDGEDDDP